MNERPPTGPETCDLDRLEGRDVLDAWARRWLHHLHTGCRRCWASLADASKPEATLDRAELARVLGKAQAEAPQLFAGTVQDREEANRFVDRLERLSPEHQRLVIANSKWAETPVVCDILIERSLRTRWVDEGTTLLFAELAVQAADRLPMNVGLEQKVRSLTQLGAARKITSDFTGAVRSLEEAGGLLEGNREQPGLLAQVKMAQTAVSTSRGRFQESRRLNVEVSTLFAECGDLLGEAHARIQLGMIHWYAGNASLALPPTAKALRLGKVIENRELRLLAFNNLIGMATDGGELETAGSWIKDARPVFENFAPPRLLRQFEWAEAEYDGATGSLRVAAGKLHRLRDHFRDASLLAHRSTASLDLAKIYLRLGRRSAAHPLLLEVVDICRELDIKHQSREARALLHG